ncbi:MAG TPA: hypothetical protein VJ962_02810 [Clostridia bacterium]|nr:hypothetical protein [Clostridia bacterium]
MSDKSNNKEKHYFITDKKDCIFYEEIIATGFRIDNLQKDVKEIKSDIQEINENLKDLNNGGMKETVLQLNKEIMEQMLINDNKANENDVKKWKIIAGIVGSLSGIIITMMELGVL